MSQVMHFDLHEDSPARRRLALALLLATVLHLGLLWGVGFLPGEKARQRQPPQLEVTLVQTPSKQAPEQADYLGDANQQGSGEQEQRQRPETLLPAQSPAPAEPVPVASSQPPQSQQPSRLRGEQLTREQATPPVPVEPEPQPPVETAHISAAELISRSHDIASLEAEVGQTLRAYAQMPRRKFVSASTREHKYAAYMDAWRRKVERIGNLNFPEQARAQRLSGSLVLEVAVLPDGQVAGVEILRSSGHAVLDEAAKRIVYLAAPFAPFPDSIRKETDVLHITRTWKFVAGGSLTTGN